MASPLQLLRTRVRDLEADPDMRKGRLVQSIIRDSTIPWDALFVSLAMRGRHRAKMRWRRAVVEEAIRRPFLRGGARRRRSRCPPSPVAPTAVDHQHHCEAELDAFAPEAVWCHFRSTFPVLALYRVPHT